MIYNTVKCYDGTNTFYFFYNDSKYAADGFVLNGTDTYLYTKNLQGDITGIADANGIIVTTYTYDAWGKIISVTGTQSATIGNANPFRYRGYYYDAETELYYLQSRYYSPEWGRLLSIDTYIDCEYVDLLLPVDLNVYAYCKNNSISYMDMTGKAATSISKALMEEIIATLCINLNIRTHFYCDISLYGNAGKMSIDLSEVTFISAMRKGIKRWGKTRMYDFVAKLACDKFYDEYWNLSPEDEQPRQFLFSKECVANEIGLHFEGYLGAIGYEGFSIPTMFSVYAFRVHPISATKRKKFIISACKSADIAEEDVNNIVDKIGFDYFNGIRSCYQYTLADPFYRGIPNSRISDTPLNENWYIYICNGKYKG